MYKSKTEIESHLSYNTNKIMSELIHEIIVYGYYASDNLQDDKTLRFYNRVEQLGFLVKDIGSSDLIFEKEKEILKFFEKDNLFIDRFYILEEVKSYYKLLLNILQERQYFFRISRPDKKKDEEVIDSHNSFDTNKLIAVQLMTIVGTGSEAGDFSDFKSYYLYFNRVDMLYLFVSPILDKEEKDVLKIRGLILQYILLFETKPEYRTTTNLSNFSKLIKRFHSEIIGSLQRKKYFFRTRKVRDKSLNSDIYQGSVVYGD